MEIEHSFISCESLRGHALEIDSRTIAGEVESLVQRTDGCRCRAAVNGFHASFPGSIGGRAGSPTVNLRDIIIVDKKWASR
jgi:hypothetical protein